ncbi:MAG TPA: aminopeptidase [Gemmatimonadales bacterium]
MRVSGWRAWRRLAAWAAAAVVIVLVLAVALSSDVRFVLRGAYEQGRLMLRRRPLTEALADSTLPAAWRENMRLVIEARAFADTALGLTPGPSFTTFAEVGRDTLVLVLSAAPKHSLDPHRWWFPIVGAVPYRGFFSRARAEAAARDFEARGYDTSLRPASAFSTLGWFKDPLLSTTVRGHRAAVVETVIHEMTHTTLYVPNATPFDESLAHFVGYRGAEAFFRARGDAAAVAWVAGVWRDEIRLGAFYAALVDSLRAAYARHPAGPALDSVRAHHYGGARARLASGLDGTLERYDGARLAANTLNNATVVATTIYRTRLARFEALYQQNGNSVRQVMERMAAALDTAGTRDPFAVLDALINVP